MTNRITCAVFLVAFFISAWSPGIRADPAAGPICQSADAPSLLVLASLEQGEGRKPSAEMSVSPGFLFGKPASVTPPQMLAGRCGSSNYYCESPGFTYCCGNSEDGFYCAADVNGCNR